MMSLPPSHADKTALRRELLERRRHLTDADRASWNEAISRKLERWFEMTPCATLGVFWPIRQEPDLLPLYQQLAARGMRLALPVVVGKEVPLRFAAWSPDDAMEKDAFGVPVPVQPTFVAMPEALLVPCVGFNAQGFRLGYGGGFYDRTLALTPKPVAIGVAYACSLTEFEVGAHDIALDMMVTN